MITVDAKRTSRKPGVASGAGGGRVKGGAAGLGVVDSFLQRAAGLRSAPVPTPARLIEALRVGLPVQEFDDLQAGLGVPQEALGALLGISKATLHRRKATGRLAPGESDRVVRFARLVGTAIEVLESMSVARQWLTSPQFGLGGAVPLDYARTEVGAREVEDLLGRIEHGVYS